MQLGLAPTEKEARLTVTIDPGWAISSLTQPEGGTMPTEITVQPPYRLAGKIKAPKPKREEESAFGVPLEKHSGTVVFAMPLEGAWQPGDEIIVEITYQACDDETCLFPQTEKLSAKIPAAALTDRKDNS